MMKHEIIMASAGSGKTYRLSNRIIALLLNGVDPKKVIALTFTRKAAGEFAGALFEKIAEAAKDSEKAVQISADLGKPGQYSQEDFLLVLEKVVSVLPELYLGTLDSFFTRIVQAFQMELGLNGGQGLQILEGAELQELKTNIISQLLFGEGVSSEYLQEFLQAFKLANFGKEKVSVQSQMEDFVENWHRAFLSHGKLTKWGSTEALTNGRGVKPFAEVRTELVTDWEKLIDEIEVPDKRGKRGFESVPEQIESFHGGSNNLDVKKWPLKQILEQADSFLSGLPVTLLNYKKEVFFTAEQSRKVGCLIQAFADEELRVRAIRSEALWSVMGNYEAYYDLLARQEGKLEFEDLKHLLGKWKDNEQARITRESIDYRLDARYDHWLLDEFQDTSQDQWNALEPLLDEIGQDRSGERSLFVVGDTKQAIYQWRGGDPKLFFEVAQRYGIDPDDMSTSWRSQEPVLELVNLVCGNMRVIQACFGKVVERWQWQDHLKAEKLPVKQSYSEVRTFTDAEDKKQYLVEQLRTIDAVGRSLSCAVLVRKNADVASYAELLREKGFSVAEEGRTYPATDNPVGLLILDFLRWLHNPSDDYALQHLQMSPLVHGVPSLVEAPHEVWLELTYNIKRASINEVISGFIGQVELSDFSIDRYTLVLEQIAGLKPCLETIIQHLENWNLSVAEASGMIQVMTIHQSKGLGFDVVILPEISDRGVTTGKALEKAFIQNEFGDSFVIPPPKWTHVIYPEIEQAVDEWQDEQYYDAFCLLYVALTRAKRALYCLLPEKLKTESDNLAGWIATALPDSSSEGLLYQCGDEGWYEAATPKTQKDEAKLENTRISLPVKRGRQTLNKSSAKTAFSENSALSRGLAMHEIMEMIEWLPSSIDDVPDTLKHDIIERPYGEEVLRLLEMPEVYSIFVKPKSAEVDLFIELQLEWIDEKGLWNTARVDRFWVVSDGAIKRISLVDFKTDDIESSKELIRRHRAQLNNYKKALRLIYGDEIEIEASLLNLSHGYVATLES